MELLIRHWPLKLASLAVAVGLWLLVAVADRVHLAVSAPIEPSSVVVKGPRSTIGARDTIETAPVDITGSRAPITQTVGLVLPEMVYPVQGGNVQVTVDIRPERAASRKGEP